MDKWLAKQRLDLIKRDFWFVSLRKKVVNLLEIYYLEP